MRFGRVTNYGKRAEEELCLLVQIEAQEALDNLEAIASFDGVDGVFIGPADLAASLGHVGQPGNPGVTALIENAIARIRTTGEPAGILTPDNAFAARCIEIGTLFMAVGVDAAMLVKATAPLARQFKA
jgi:4-hydroxy-2-oxoheptanedioate aldolase